MHTTHMPCPQHNYCIENGAMSAEVLPEDLRGEPDPELAEGGQRRRPVDHLGRDRPLDPRAVNLSGPTTLIWPPWRVTRTPVPPLCCRREYDSSEYSPRDPQYDLTAKPGAHQAALCAPRAAVTARMEAVGQIRPPSAPVHW